MIISTSNAIRNNTASITAGTLTSGVVSDVLNPDFSSVITSTSSVLTFTVGVVVGCKYIGLHGLNLPLGTVVTVSAAGYSDTFTTVNAANTNIVFYVADVSLDNLQVTLSGSGTKTISYIQAGDATVVPWGTDAGQSLYYLGYNSKNRTSINSLGAPVIRTQKRVAPKLKLNIKNVFKTWARGDLQNMFDHYQQHGVLSILDYEDADRQNESVAGFNLDSVSVKTHSDTLSLCNVSFSVQVSV